MDNRYSYEALDSFEHIRLLILEPGRPDTPLQCDIIQVSIHKNHVQYEAISYVWGSSDQPSKIITPRGYISITASLDRVLRRLRLQESRRVVWADAICINQNDKTEKAVQVPLMSDIYAKAVQTLICLTEPLPPPASRSVLDAWYAKLKLGMCWFVLFGTSLVKKRWPPTWAEVKAVDLALNQSWFGRVWTVQELVVSRYPTVLYGSFQWNWNKFSDIAVAVGVFEAHLSMVFSMYGLLMIVLLSAGLEYFDSQGQWRMLASQNSILSLLKNASRFLALTVTIHKIHFLISSSFIGARSQRSHHVVDDLDGLRRSSREPLLNRLRILQRSPRSCYLARDHLFAVLGMILVDEAQCELVRPDYDEPIKEVVLRYAEMLQGQGHTFELLHRASSVPLSSQFPSWVPDWTKPFEDPLHRHTLRNLDRFPNLTRIDKIVLKVGSAMRIDLASSDSAFYEGAWVRTVSRTQPKSTLQTANCKPPSDTLTLTGSFAGPISSISDFSEWYSFRNDIGTRRTGMGTVSSTLAFFKHVLIVGVAFSMYYLPSRYKNGAWQHTIAHFSAILTSEAALLNPFQASIYPTKELRPGNPWPARLLAYVGDCYFMLLDIIVFAMTWVRPARWDISRIFDHFPGYQDSFWRLWGSFEAAKEWQVLSLSNMRLGVFNSKPCLVFSDTVEVNDMVVYFDGSRIPFIVRPSKDRPGYWRLVGECYDEDFTAGVTTKFEAAKEVIRLH